MKTKARKLKHESRKERKNENEQGNIGREIEEKNTNKEKLEERDKRKIASGEILEERRREKMKYWKRERKREKMRTRRS